MFEQLGGTGQRVSDLRRGGDNCRQFRGKRIDLGESILRAGAGPPSFGSKLGTPIVGSKPALLQPQWLGLGIQDTDFEGTARADIITQNALLMLRSGLLP